MFMVDLLDSLPRLRLSDDQLKMFLWVMKMCKTPDVPAFSALRRVQQELCHDIGVQPSRYVSSLGNEFYANSPVKTLRLVSMDRSIITFNLPVNTQDWANPLVRPHIRPFIEITSSSSCKVSEIFQADRLLEEDVDLLQPMWADFEHAPNHHFYIKELAMLHNGQLVIPMKWICKVGDNGKSETMLVDAYTVTKHAESDQLTVQMEKYSRFKCADLVQNYLELQKKNQLIFRGKSPACSAEITLT